MYLARECSVQWNSVPRSDANMMGVTHRGVNGPVDDAGRWQGAPAATHSSRRARSALCGTRRTNRVPLRSRASILDTPP